MGPMVEFGNIRVIKIPKFLTTGFTCFFVLTAYGLGEISECGGGGEIQFFGGIVGENPGKNWVLEKEVRASARIEIH